MSVKSSVISIALEMKKKRKVKKYTELERASAVLRVLENEKQTHVAKSIGVKESTVRGWVSMWKREKRLPGSGHRRLQKKANEKKAKVPAAEEKVAVPTSTLPVGVEDLPASSTLKKRIATASSIKIIAKKKREATSDAKVNPKVTQYNVASTSPTPTPKIKLPNTRRSSKWLHSQEVQRRQELMNQPFPYDFFGALNLMRVPGALTPPPTPESVSDAV